MNWEILLKIDELNLSVLQSFKKKVIKLQLTLRAYDIDNPTIPGDRESLAMTANKAAKNTIQLPTNSSRTANHLKYISSRVCLIVFSWVNDSYFIL